MGVYDKGNPCRARGLPEDAICGAQDAITDLVDGSNGQGGAGANTSGPEGHLRTTFTIPRQGVAGAQSRGLELSLRTGYHNTQNDIQDVVNGSSGQGVGGADSQGLEGDLKTPLVVPRMPSGN